ncbi:RHS repeat-associated core domain-containing protein [uncultured Psychroserpens sp.]|uniref:RHS repeat-associated core domain-containing protein n=1 Tax=uncultured Psychroserpens sp. TaxID=255436 RepID=UPI00262A21C9|nr:RHS repeat-associated core domain-containing protein [uncultured Psychroserpens sp.]
MVLDYYPFGLKHKGYNDAIVNANVALNWKFGGKEFSEELDLNTYDFGARNYNPDLGRWSNIDALSDAKGQIHNSLYAYTMNNPIFFADPDGNCPEGVDCNEVGTVSENNSDSENMQIAVKRKAKSVWNGLKAIGSAYINPEQVGSMIVNSFSSAAPYAKALSENGISGLGGAIVDGITSDMQQIAHEEGISHYDGAQVWAYEAAFDATAMVLTEGSFSTVNTTTKVMTKVADDIVVPSKVVDDVSKSKSIKASNGIEVTGFTKHGLDQKMDRGVSSSSMLQAIKEPLQIGPVKFDDLGRPSQRFVGEKGTIAVNPQTGKVVSVNPTSTKRAARLKRKQE